MTPAVFNHEWFGLDVQPGEVVFDKRTGKLVAVLWVMGKQFIRVKFLSNTGHGFTIRTSFFESRAECLAWVGDQLAFESGAVRRYERDWEDE
jgi:hypothetical protein